MKHGIYQSINTQQLTKQLQNIQTFIRKHWKQQIIKYQWQTINIRATSWEDGPSDICKQQSFRRACTSVQSCQKLCCLPEVLARPSACESKQQSFWQDCVDVQARLKLCCLHMSKGPFSHNVAHMSSKLKLELAQTAEYPHKLLCYMTLTLITGA